MNLQANPPGVECELGRSILVSQDCLHVRLCIKGEEYYGLTFYHYLFIDLKLAMYLPTVVFALLALEPVIFTKDCTRFRATYYVPNPPKCTASTLEIRLVIC